MKTCASLALVALLVSGAAHAQNFTQTNTDRAKALIDAAIEAHGGERLREMRTLVIEQRSVNHSVGQSLGTEPPWDTNEGEGLDAIDQTPVLDIKPYISGFAPRGDVREPAWAKEVMGRYW